MKQKILMGNWKSNPNYKEAIKLKDELIYGYDGHKNIKLIITPPAVYLSEFSSALVDDENIILAAQNVSAWRNGAYTGEVSAEMLLSLGVSYAIVGHSERRAIFGESDAFIGQKVNMLLDFGVTPVICLGESLEERKSNQHLNVIESQMQNIAKEFTLRDVDTIVLAYEPVWAIGTGETANVEQIEEMHQHIHQVAANIWGNENAERISILYGGSCKPDNGEAIFNVPKVDGGLIGGAALKSQDFLTLAKQLANSK